MTKPTICLSMIVKDEAHVIARCLKSVLPLIDSYLIHDTGSKDDTIAAIQEIVGHLPGEVVSVPWVNFADNRNAALDAARPRADYVLIMDADDFMVIDSPPLLGAFDIYNIEMRSGAVCYHRPLLVRASTPASYCGAVHEYLDVPPAAATGALSKLYVESNREGARSNDPAKYRRDALLLEEEMLTNPDDPRTVFYLAQSYRDAGDNELALRYYERRTQLTGGWIDEHWYALYQIARIKEQMGIFEPEQIVGAYLKAWQFMPERAEPLYRAAIIHQSRREFWISHMLLERARSIRAPAATRLFVERDIYEIHVPLELAVACYWIGDDARAIQINASLLVSRGLPEMLRETVKANLIFSRDRICRGDPTGSQRRAA